MQRESGPLIFIDETSIKTKMTPLRHHALKGRRFRGDIPFGKRHTQTFIAGLRCDGLLAPWVINGAVDGAAFDTYIRTQFAPTMRHGDVIICNNLNLIKARERASPRGARGMILFFYRGAPLT
ncbi:MAG: transposase [Pseudomonadota bacterium]